MPEARTKVTYADKELLASGSFLTFGSGETTIAVGLGDEEIRLVIVFSGAETDTSKQKLESSLPDEQTLRGMSQNVLT